MNTTKKITKRDRFTTLLTYAEVKANPDMVAFIEHEIELLNNRNTGDRKPTAQQVANEGVKEILLSVLRENGDKMTITEMQKSNDELGELSNQRISAILKQMYEGEGATVEKIIDKRKTYFKAVEMGE
jgi:hypothetical protein